MFESELAEDVEVLRKRVKELECQVEKHKEEFRNLEFSYVSHIRRYHLVDGEAQKAMKGKKR